MKGDSSSFREPNVGGCSFRSVLFSGAVTLSKLGTNGRKMEHSPREDRSFVRLVGGQNSRIASVVCEAISRRLGRITCPKKAIMSLRN